MPDAPDGRDRERQQDDPGSQGFDLEKLLEERARLEELIHKKFTQTITVMFTDFKGSTAIAESEGDVTSRLLIKKHHDMLFPLIQENGGTLVKTMGDGTLSWFAKAQNAVRVAVEFQKRLKEFNKGRPTGKTPLLVRIGLNTGVGIVEENDIFGDAVNVAARFETLAAPSEICFSETTYDSLENRDEFRCRLVKTTELKGKVGLHKVFKVFWNEEESMDEAPPAAAPPPPAARPGIPPYLRPGSPQGGPRLGIPFHAGPSVPKRPLGAGKLTEDRGSLERATNEVRSLVVRKGDTCKMSGEGYKIYDDIVVEQGGLLVVENAQLFFADNAGIVSTGTFRAKNALFSAMNPVKGWRNVSLDPRDGRVNPIEGCTFNFGKGRPWGSLPSTPGTANLPLNETYLCGGGLLLKGAAERSVSVSNCVFRRCSAHKGGGIFVASSRAEIAGCTFDGCSAGISGGGVYCIEAPSTLRACTFSGCSADKGGGGMACHAASPVIENCSFDRCASKFLYGGGLHCADSSPAVTVCRFNRCSAGKDGGGIYSDAGSNPKVLQTTFTECMPNGSNAPGGPAPPGKWGRFL